MYSGTVIKPYWGFEVGDRIYLREKNITFKWSVDLYKTEDLSSFVVTVWDINEFRECVKLAVDEMPQAAQKEEKETMKNKIHQKKPRSPKL